jgi:cytidylate kinase
MSKKKIIITIAREFGTNGHEMGMILSERLGLPFYDKDILSKAAHESGMELEKVKEADEKVKSLLTKPIFGYSIGMGDEDRLFQAEERIIKEVAQESCIIIGHLADYILKDDPDCIKVFIYAPFEERVKMIAKKYHIAEEEARKVVRKMDQSRSNFYTYYSNGKWEHGKGKDLILNRSTISLEDCVEMIAHLVELKTKDK